MKTRAVRIYGANDLRLEEFELPDMAKDQILARVVSNSLCMSCHKAAARGGDHKRVPAEVGSSPTIIGHEFSGRILEVGSKWKDRYSPGEKFVLQPALNYPDRPDAIGYSFESVGGNATNVLIPSEVIERGCVLGYEGGSYFAGSLAEPLSCIHSGLRGFYHVQRGAHEHITGIRRGGNMAILGGAGPMGLGAIDLVIHGERKPQLLVVADIDAPRLSRASQIYTTEEAQACGVKLQYVDMSQPSCTGKTLLELTAGRGFDDVFVFAPDRVLVEQADSILGEDGCLNFFAGPTDQAFSASINMYNVHYSSTHVVGTTGGNPEDLLETLRLIESGSVNPATMITHIGGLNAAADATLRLPGIPGGKKLIYTGIDMELTAIADFAAKAKENPLFAGLARICEANDGLWSAEAEQLLLESLARMSHRTS
jgi:threonine dehydrogenase-like Zn-dependent dehydrogenase